MACLLNVDNNNKRNRNNLDDYANHHKYNINGHKFKRPNFTDKCHRTCKLIWQLHRAMWTTVTIMPSTITHTTPLPFPTLSILQVPTIHLIPNTCRPWTAAMTCS